MKPITPINLDKLPPGQRLRLAAEVLRTYTRVRWVMRDEDAERAVRRLRIEARDAVETTEPAGENDRELLAAWRLAQATRKVLERLPSDSRCLFRSLTVMSMLERRAIPQTLVVAVRPRPFGAHAWVEVAGRAILPEADPGYERILEI